MNAHVERLSGSLKGECLDHLILFGESSLRNAAREYVTHYHAERNHQGLNNLRIEEPSEEDSHSGDVIEEERLGGLLRHYRRAAA